MIGWPNRVLTAEIREGEWTDYSCEPPKQHSGTYWTVVDRDTREQIGSFGFPVETATETQALEEAERFGSKWGWETVKGGTPWEGTVVDVSTFDDGGNQRFVQGGTP